MDDENSSESHLPTPDERRLPGRAPAHADRGLRRFLRPAIL